MSSYSLLVTSGDGATSVTLHRTSAAVALDFALSDPPSDATRTSETFTVAALTLSDAKRIVTTLNRLFHEARVARSDVRLTPSYVQFRQSDAEPWYYSLLYDGHAGIGSEGLRWQWAEGTIEITVTWEREIWWAEQSLTELPLRTSGGTDATGGVALVNQGGTTPDNTLWIDPLDIAGDVPAPMRMIITNTVASDTALLKTLYVGLNVWNSPHSATYQLQGEAATGMSSVASGSASGGAYGQASWTSTGETTVATWTLSTMLGAWNGASVRAILRTVSQSYTDLSARLQLRSGSLVVWSSEQVSVGEALTELATMPLPPGVSGGASYSTLSLDLVVQRALSGTHTIRVDDLHLLPLDGWRMLTARGGYVGTNAMLIDDGGYLTARPTLHVEASGGERSGHYLGYGPPLMLVPNRAQRLVFLHATGADTSPATRTIRVKIYYAPRRRVIS